MPITPYNHDYSKEALDLHVGKYGVPLSIING